MPCCQVQRTSLSEGQGSTLRGSAPSRCPDRILLIEKGLKVQVARNYQYIDNRSFMSTITFLGFPRLRACANRLANFSHVVFLYAINPPLRCLLEHSLLAYWRSL